MRTKKNHKRSTKTKALCMGALGLFLLGSYSMFITTDQAYASIDTTESVQELSQEIAQLESAYHASIQNNSYEVVTGSSSQYARIPSSVIGMLE